MGNSIVIVGLVYLIFWVLLGKKLSNRKIQLSKRAGWQQVKEEIGVTIISSIGTTVFMVLMLTLKEGGITKFYIETGKFGLWYEVLSGIVILLISDAWFYWSHRVMHHPSIYKYVHALHHRSLDVNPFTATSFHVIESVWLTLWLLPLVLVMPISMTVLGVVQVLGMFNNLKSHLGYELYPGVFSKPPFNMLVTATNHSLHHTQYNGNYGLFFRFWDIVCGTELKDTATTFTDINTRKHTAIIDNTTYRVLTISTLEKENNNTISVYFQPTDEAFYNYKAGQYLTIKVNIKGRNYTRCFSLSSTPQLDNFLRITVKLKGDVSHYFYNQAKVGDTIKSLLPVGDFTVTPNSEATNNYIMIAGGSGITPLYSMIKQILHDEPNSTLTLLYANTTEDNIIFKKEIEELAIKNKQFVYKYFISGKSRIGKEDLTVLPNAIYFICGPNSLKDGMTQYLNELSVPKVNINVEHFADGYVSWFGLFKRKQVS
jgi:ring-1,2-phenylacetyl-CoA epoxidase subunit PaaE